MPVADQQYPLLNLDCHALGRQANSSQGTMSDTLPFLKPPFLPVHLPAEDLDFPVVIS